MLAAALLMRESKVARKERRNGNLMVGDAPLFAGFEGEGEGVGGLVVAATEAEVVVGRVVWGLSVPTVKVLDPWTMHIRSVLEAHKIGGISLGAEGVVDTAFGTLEEGVEVWAAVIVNVVDLIGVTVYPEVQGAEGKPGKGFSLRLRRPDPDAADIRDARVQKRSRRNGILMLDAPLVAGFDVMKVKHS